jgi:lipopolysaccharide export LptBFGC system permease protein LptF
MARELTRPIHSRRFSDTKARQADATLGVVTIFGKGAFFRRRTYQRILYQLISLPLAVIYFTVIVTGISLGLGLAVIGIGLLVAIATVWVWRWFATLERELTIHLLGVSVPSCSKDAVSRRW